MMPQPSLAARVMSGLDRRVVIGVSIGDPLNKATWRIDYTETASPAERQQAQARVDAFDPAAPTPDEVIVERNRRLSDGFDYDFGDARGVHRIGTTRADLEGWSEVSTYVGALLDSGDVTTKIRIVTDTGPCELTAPEWRAIEIAAAAFRQPIWTKSFVVLASLPVDYKNDAHWT